MHDSRFPTPNSRPYRIAVLASGRGSNFLALQRAIEAGKIRHSELIGVFSDRGNAPVLRLAAEHGVAAHSWRPADYPQRSDFDRALFAALAVAQPDLIVCAGFMRIISGEVLPPWQGRMINIHPSLLPRYPGLHTHRRALQAGDREHGASVHLVTADLDAGPVLAQARVAVLPDDDEQLLAQRVLQREHPLLVACVAALADGRLNCRSDPPQWQNQDLLQPLRLNADNRLEPSACAEST